MNCYGTTIALAQCSGQKRDGHPLRDCRSIKEFMVLSPREFNERSSTVIGLLVTTKNRILGNQCRNVFVCRARGSKKSFLLRFQRAGGQFRLTVYAIGAGQTVAAIVVVASLLFVGIQVRDGARATRSATSQAVHENYASWYLALADNARALETSTKGFVDLGA